MSDIVERWTLGGYGPGNYRCTCSTCKSEFTGDKRATQCLPCAGRQAADEIDRLRAALRDILDGFGLNPPHYVGVDLDADDLWIVNAARAALGEKA